MNTLLTDQGVNINNLQLTAAILGGYINIAMSAGVVQKSEKRHSSGSFTYPGVAEPLKVPRTPLESRQGYHPKQVRCLAPPPLARLTARVCVCVCVAFVSVFILLCVGVLCRMSWSGNPHQLAS